MPRPYLLNLTLLNYFSNGDLPVVSQDDDIILTSAYLPYEGAEPA